MKNGGFSTINGTFYSKVAQQGDHNSMVTLHRLVNNIFHGLLSRSMRAYADDLWSLSDTWRQHKLDVIAMMMRCQLNEFIISLKSITIHAEDHSALG